MTAYKISIQLFPFTNTTSAGIYIVQLFFLFYFIFFKSLALTIIAAIMCVFNSDNTAQTSRHDTVIKNIQYYIGQYCYYYYHVHVTGTTTVLQAG